MESYEIQEFTRQKEPAKKVGAELVNAREANEVQMAMLVAKKFPRDMISSYEKIMADCSRATLAEKAIYQFPRGGSTVAGPSIHLARALVRGWGNTESGFKVLEQSQTESTVIAYCWDLETNYREVKVFTVPHVRETKKGNYPLTDPRDIYEMVANQAARRERSCILSVIPADVVDAAVARCQDTLRKKGGSMPLQDKIRALVGSFQKQYGVTRAQLEKYAGVRMDAFSEQTVLNLKGVYNSIRDGEGSPDQYFDMSLTAPSIETTTPAQPVEPTRRGMSLDDL